MDERDEERLLDRVRALADQLHVTTPGVQDVVRRGARRRRLANLGTAAVSVVLAGAVMLPLLWLLPIGEGGKPSDDDVPSAILSPAPRECPTGIGVHRGAGPQVNAEEFAELMQGYLPSWLPEGFGLLQAFGRQPAMDGLDASGVWADGRCREILLMFNSSWVASEPGTPYDPNVPQVGPWSLEADAANGCGNAVLGEGRCLSYATATEDGLLTIEMMGLEREEGDRIALSILAGDTETPPSLTGTLTYIEGRQAFGPIALLDAASGESQHLTSQSFSSVSVAWSPDGSMIAMARSLGEGNGELVLVSTSTGEIVRTLPIDPLMHPIDVTWAPDGRTLAFADTYADLWTIDVDGSNLRPHAIGALRAIHLEWSPDGDEIAIITDKRQLVLLAVEGGEPRIIFSPDAGEAWFSPTWSPDGNRIAFSAIVDDVGQIFVIERDGSNLMQLTDDVEDSTDPTWSPDGAWIAFTRGGDHRDIYAVTPEGSFEQRMTETDKDEYGPDWG